MKSPNNLHLRRVPNIVTAHIFCACQGSRARRERNAQHAGHVGWFCLLLVWEVLVISCGKDASFFNRWKIIYIYLSVLWKPKKYICACCYFCRMIDLTEHFIVKQRSVKLLLRDVTLGAGVLKYPLIGKDQSIRRKIALISPPLNRETASLPFTRVLRVLSTNRL